jgi:hypothetical protein
VNGAIKVTHDTTGNAVDARGRAVAGVTLHELKSEN